MGTILYSTLPDGRHAVTGPAGIARVWADVERDFPGVAALAEHRWNSVEHIPGGRDNFAHWHPRLAWLLEGREPTPSEIEIEAPEPPPIICPPITCPCPCPTISDGPLPLPELPGVEHAPPVPHVIPEPSSGALAGLGLGLAIACTVGLRTLERRKERICG